MSDPTPLQRSDDRRELILASSLNGVDAVEVLDSQAPVGTPRQRTLVATLFRAVPSGFSVANVRLDGGVRILDIGVAWAFPAPQFGDGSIPDDVVSTSEQAALETYLTARFPDPAMLALQLVIRTGTGTHDFEGDLSTYTLRLAAAADDEGVPAGFDLIFSSIDFRFKVECPRDYDCAPAGGATTDCPPESTAAPRIDYLSKDYGSFRRLMLDRLAASMPGWTERNPADVGVMLVEVMAFAADRLSYYQDAVATEAYLGTARRRVSIRRHARLLDYRMHDGCNARAWVSIASRTPDGVTLPAGTIFCTSQDADAPVLAPADLDADARLYESVQDLTLREAHGQISLYNWGSWSWFLPKGATHASLLVGGAPLALQPGDVLVLVERIGSDGTTAGADTRRRQAVRLTKVAAPDVDPLTGATFVEVDWNPGDALAFPFCVSMLADEQKLTDVSVALGNVVLVDAGAWVVDPQLPRPVDAAIYRPTLQQTGVTARQPFDDDARTAPAAAALYQDPRQALPVVRLQDSTGVLWQVEADLLGSGPDDPGFVVEIESDGTAQLRFGDGVLGLPPTADADLVASYRVASGPDDNVGAEAIAHVLTDGLTDLTTVVAVRNPLPAAGGTAPEDLEVVRQQAPQAFQVSQQRAVTEADYATVASSFAGIHRAVATRRWTGSWYTVFVSVDPEGTTTLASDLLDGLTGFLEGYRLAGEDLQIDGPNYVPLDIVMEVGVASGYFQADVQAALADVFSSGVRADGSLGFFHPDNYSFGDPVYLSRIVAAAMVVPGVASVDLSDPSRGQKFLRFGRPAAGEVALGYMPIGRFEIARADSSPNFPENGGVGFIMDGGL